MNKVICDICGTSYPESAEQCPIRGCSRELDGLIPPRDDFEYDMDYEEERPARVKGGRFSTANVRKRNKNVNNYQFQAQDEDDDPYEAHDSRQSNTFLVVLLIVLILALLAVSGFIIVRFLLPGMAGEEATEPTTTAPVIEQSEEITEEITEEPTIPCESLVLLGDSEVELVGIGQYFLINVEIQPADTTDIVLYASSDESVAVVNSEGRVEVVGEGYTTITVICGPEQVTCTLICLAEEETTEATTEETTEVPTETEPEIQLYLDKDDFTLAYVGDYYRLKFNEELSAEDITWITSNGNVAVVNNGLVTAVGYGVATITAKYGDQVVTCVVRCIW